jgi:hypothetical protein
VIWPMTVCRYHPDQPAIGLCMRCRATICAACCTRLDGINHCHACLKMLAAQPPKLRRRSPALWSAGLVLAGVWAALFGLLLLAQGELSK